MLLNSLFLICSTWLYPLVNADADFASVRTTLTKDWSGRKGDPVQKFFHESIFHPHYDGRFTDKVLKEEERRPHLVAMIQAYLATMNDLGSETWLMHGSLMGWWWNQKIMPWDSDIDVQMTLDTMQFLFNYYQLYTFHYNFPDFKDGKSYMLEINPDFAISNKWDHLNGIDARWIDMETGIFIDITAVRDSKDTPGVLNCKDKHSYNETDIFPLRDSWFEGIQCKIPYNYAWVLEEEYTKDSLSRTDWEGHRFNETTNEWEQVKEPRLRKKKKQPTGAVSPSRGSIGNSWQRRPPGVKGHMAPVVKNG